MTLMLNKAGCRCWAALLGLCLPAFGLWAADTNAPQATAPAPQTNAAPSQASAPAPQTNAVPPQATAPAPQTNAAPPQAAAPAPLTPEQMFEGGTNSFNNWIDFSTGGFITSGNKAQFQKRHQTSDGAFGGVEDFHFQKDLAKGTTLTTDGRAIFDNDDYKLSLGVTKEKLGYARFSYTEYRTWYNGDGGFYSPMGTYYPLAGDALSLDHKDITFEAGLALENVPKVTFKYEHTSREGAQSSTSWGYAQPAAGVTRGLSPSFYDINEHSDIFQLDAAHHIKATDVGVGLRYETGKLDDSLNTDQYPGQSDEQKLTDRQTTTYDLFDVHAFTETWIKKNLMLSSGFAYSDLDNNLAGSHIYGSDYGVGYVPTFLPGVGYTNLLGASHLHDYVVDLNLLYKPFPDLSIVPSLRMQKEDTDANSSEWETSGSGIPAFGALPVTPSAANGDQSNLEVRGRLDVTYKGITNWVLYARGDWTDGQDDMKAAGGLTPVPFFGTGMLIGTPTIQQETADSYIYQKYSAGARWYPTRGVTLDAGGYYKQNHYDYNNEVDSTFNGPTLNGFPNSDRYPAFLVMQSFQTYDGNFRLTLRPWRNVTLISRYEYQYSTINTKPDPISSLGETESSTMTSHILAQDVSWAPWSRLYLQAGFNYVLSETKTPASDLTLAAQSAPAILAAQNNYWTLNFNSGLVLDNKTDLKLGFFYYRANDYTDNSTAGVPYGAGAEEYGVTATLSRRITEHLRWALKYGFSHYADAAFGGNQDFSAHLIYTSLQYRF